MRTSPVLSHLFSLLYGAELKIKSVNSSNNHLVYAFIHTFIYSLNNPYKDLRTVPGAARNTRMRKTNKQTEKTDKVPILIGVLSLLGSQMLIN